MSPGLYHQYRLAEPITITRIAIDNQNSKIPLLPLPTAAGLRVSSRLYVNNGQYYIRLYIIVCRVIVLLCCGDLNNQI